MIKDIFLKRQKVTHKGVERKFLTVAGLNEGRHFIYSTRRLEAVSYCPIDYYLPSKIFAPEIKLRGRWSCRSWELITIYDVRLCPSAAPGE